MYQTVLLVMSFVLIGSVSLYLFVCVCVCVCVCAYWYACMHLYVIHWFMITIGRGAMFSYLWFLHMMWCHYYLCIQPMLASRHSLTCHDTASDNLYYHPPSQQHQQQQQQTARYHTMCMLPVLGQFGFCINHQHTHIQYILYRVDSVVDDVMAVSHSRVCCSFKPSPSLKGLPHFISPNYLRRLLGPCSLPVCIQIAFKQQHNIFWHKIGYPRLLSRER